MFPRSENKLLAYLIDTEAFEEIHSGFEHIGEHHYSGVSVIYEDVYFGAYGTKSGINGKLYGLPGYTNNLMEFDPLSDEVKKLFSLKTEFEINYAGARPMKTKIFTRSPLRRIISC